MSEVWITKTGFKVTYWDSEIRQNVEKKVRTLLHELRSHCHIEKEVTLEDIFRAVNSDKPLMSFIGNYSWCDIPAFHQEAMKPSISPSKLSYLEISRYTEIWDNEISVMMDFHGVEEGNEQKFAIELTPVNDLKHLPVVLSMEEKIYNCEEGMKVIASGVPSFTLLEVIGEIYYEISFHGSPVERNEFANDFLQVVEDIKEGKIKTVPFDLEDKKVQ